MKAGTLEFKDIFGCGYGTVTRWFRAAFPNSRIHITDLDKLAVEFCTEHWGCEQILDQISGPQFDLIWLGSVLTHMPGAVAEPLLQQLLQQF